MPEEHTATGRSVEDLPDEYPQGDDARAAQHAVLTLFETVGVETFNRAAASLSSHAGQPLYVIDVSASGKDLLALSPVSKGSTFFELPALCVEGVTPLGIRGDDPLKVVASVAFRPEFRSLATALGRLSAAPAAGVGDAAGADLFTSESCGPEDARTTSEDDDDPAKPAPGELPVEVALDPGTARALANYGAVEPDTSEPAITEQFEEELPAARAETRQTPLNIVVARSFLNACMTSSPRVRYGLGAKVPFHGATPGRHFRRVDCSGFVREAIWRATTPRLNFPDGSVVQHDWVRKQGFTRGTPADGRLRDGAVRIAFLRPQDSPSRIGHVVLVHNARTLESHGGVGPNSRDWAVSGWQRHAFVYLLTPPTA